MVQDFVHPPYLFQLLIATLRHSLLRQSPKGRRRYGRGMLDAPTGQNWDPIVADI